jgi:hypothetical protein
MVEDNCKGENTTILGAVWVDPWLNKHSKDMDKTIGR